MGARLRALRNAELDPSRLRVENFRLAISEMSDLLSDDVDTRKRNDLDHDYPSVYRRFG